MHTHPVLRRCSTSPVRAPTGTNRTPFIVTHTIRPVRAPTRRPSLSHTTRPILRSAAGSRNSRPPSYTPAGECSRRSPTLPSLGSAAVSRCDHYSCRPSCPRCFRCDKRPCIVCTTHLLETSTFNSSNTKDSFQIRHRLTCQSSNIVYLLYCDTCQQSQYVRETKNTLKTRFYQHRSNINKNTGTLVAKHFRNQTDHSIHNMKGVAVEKVRSEKREDRLRREAFWIQKLKILVPCGLNTLD